MADMSRQLDVLSPGDGAVEPVSRAIAMREEIELQKAAMELQREEARARQEAMKADLQQRELERVTSVEQNEKQMRFAAEEAERSRQHESGMQEARKVIEQQLMRDTEQFAREREERQLRYDTERQRRGIEAYRAMREEEVAAARRHNDIVSRLMDAQVLSDVYEGKMTLNLAELERMAGGAAAAHQQATTLLREQLAGGAVAVEGYAEEFESGRLQGTTQVVPVGGMGGAPQVTRIAGPNPAEVGVRVISSITDVLSLEQREAVEGVYRTLVSLPGSGPVSDTQKAAVTAALEAAKSRGVTTTQLDTILDGVASAIQAQVRAETNPVLRGIYQQNLDGIGRAMSFGIVPQDDQWASMAQMPARLVAAMRDMEVPEEEIAAMAGELYRDPEFMKRVREAQRLAQEFRGVRTQHSDLTKESLDAASAAQMGPSPEVLENLMR